MIRLPLREQGAVLVIGLIMLLLLSLMVVASQTAGRTSLMIVQNLQNQIIALDLANSTLEEAISSPRLVNAPAAIFVPGCNGVVNTRCFDLDADGVMDVSVALQPQPFCIQAQTIQNSQLNLDDPEEAACLFALPVDPGIQLGVSNDSLCAMSMWEVTAVATDAVTGARQTVVGHYAVRVATDSIATSCP